MYLHEETMDLFDVPRGYYIAHCITGDLSFGAGIAKEINERYDMANAIRNILAQADCEDIAPKDLKGVTVWVGDVCNLITKAYPSKKVKRRNIQDCLDHMYAYCDQNYVKKIAMPRICCGMDGMDWSEIKPMIEETFEDLDIEIMVVHP